MRLKNSTWNLFKGARIIKGSKVRLIPPRSRRRKPVRSA